MTNQARRTMLAVGVLLIAGVVRMPIEQSLAQTLRSQELLQKPVSMETSKKVGQGFWAVSLGGLRTLVATILNLRAHAFFEGQKWEQVADTYETIVQLAPHSSYYWDIGHWHMAYNAASHYHYESDLPAIRARGEWRKWIHRGAAFLEEGTRQNPDNERLWNRLGWLYSDPNKLVDYDKAADAYHQAVATGNALPYVARAEAYALARSPTRIDEALPLVKKLLNEPGGRVPTLLSLRLVLEHRENPDVPLLPLALELFGSRERAYRNLSNYYLGVQDNYPMNGVTDLLRMLEQELGIPAEKSVFELRAKLLDE